MDKALAIQKEVMRILGTDEVYLVGGSVRDLVMGNEPKDYDFCTPLLPDEMEARIQAAGRRVYAIGKQFGTIGFKVPVVTLEGVSQLSEPDENGVFNVLANTRSEYEYVEVTTFRSEVYTSKSRKPEVKFVPSLDEDLARRDFTMNAMVLLPDGTIYDPYGGKLDIHAKQIKTVGQPKERIMEDPLRMLRAARFAARYGFTIDPNFIGKARQLADRIYDVSVERWVQELDKLITSPHSYNGWEQLEKMGLSVRILPEVREPNFMYGTELDKAWALLLNNSGFGNTHAEICRSPCPFTRYLNTGICLRLKFSNERTDIVLDKKKPTV